MYQQRLVFNKAKLHLKYVVVVSYLSVGSVSFQKTVEKLDSMHSGEIAQMVFIEIQQITQCVVLQLKGK